MQLKVRMKFTDPWSTIISEVSKQCNMSVDEYCRRAVQVLTKQGLDQGEAEHGKSESNDSSGDAVGVRARSATDSHVLADQGNTQPDPAI